MPKATLMFYPANYMEIIKFAVSKPYGKDVSDSVVQKVIAAGHLSVLEHVSITFDIDCSKRVLGQLSRHRHCSPTVKSARASEFNTFIDPITFNEYPLQNTIAGAEYFDKLDEYALEEAAYYLPEGAKTNLAFTANMRAWFEYLPKRLCKRAMPEHRLLAKQIHEQLSKAMPEIFDRNFMDCANCKEYSCKFK